MSADDELDELRLENTELKREVQRLSDEMDRIQHRRHSKKKSAGKVTADSKLELVNAEVRIAIQQNEDLRKERLKLTAELAHSDTGRRISETKNALAVVERKIEHAKHELKALENLKKERQDVVDVAVHTEEEVRLFRSQHRQELNGFKDEALELNEEQKGLDRKSMAMQEAAHRIQQKIKRGINGDAFKEVQAKVAEQEAEIAQLSEQISKVAGDIACDTARENAELKGLRTDKTALHARIEELKQALVERERELKLSYQLSKQPGSPRGTVSH